MTKIVQKWGFGMAPVKPETQKRRINAAKTLLRCLGETDTVVDDVKLQAVSEIKGCFSRSWKCDQWDWFTVWCQFAFRPHGQLVRLSSSLTAFRKALKAGDQPAIIQAMNQLEGLQLIQLLEIFIGVRLISKPPGLVYALGTRESPNILKIGMTTRDPVTRVNEINAATGVIVPFGVRGTWAVTEPRGAEAAAHQALAEFRVRSDREFFELPFGTAKALITEAVSNFRVPLSIDGE
ncbi:MAG: GIY-YIG nuclease family protein [Maricaulis sp.]|nr:GIY-YIG nuclease family protein [Maricaulis sp.]